MAKNGVFLYAMFAEVAVIDNPAGENSFSGLFKADQWLALASLIMYI